MKSIAIYARVSSEQQALQATIESQVVALEEQRRCRRARDTAAGHLLGRRLQRRDAGPSGAGATA